MLMSVPPRSPYQQLGYVSTKGRAGGGTHWQMLSAAAVCVVAAAAATAAKTGRETTT